MTLSRIVLAASAAFAVLAGAAAAAITGYLNIPDIPGETARASSGQSQSVGGAQTQTIGAAQSQTVKGGQAVIVGALWNGAEPKSGKPGTVTVMVIPGALSGSLTRLQSEARTIPSLKISLTENGKTASYTLRKARISSVAAAPSRAGNAVAMEQVTIAYEAVELD